jgi:hypothetical protein
MTLSESQINTIGLILHTWCGFHKTRRKYGLYISHCYVLLSFVWLESIDSEVSEGKVQRLLTMFQSIKLHYLFTFLISKGYIVLTRTSGRRNYYTLTDSGREVAALLLEGIEARQVAFFNKYLSK